MEKLTQELFDKVINILNQKESEDLERFGYSDVTFMASNFVRNWFVYHEPELSTSYSEKPTEDSEIKVTLEAILKILEEQRCIAFISLANRDTASDKTYDTVLQYLDNVQRMLLYQLIEVREKEAKKIKDEV
jgi:muramoyltetrapeptide carboxypeptidase LdcA involved in peptidoglycan recycling